MSAPKTGDFESKYSRTLLSIWVWPILSDQKRLFKIIKSAQYERTTLTLASHVIAYIRCEIRARSLQVGDVQGDTAQFYDIWAAANAVNIICVLRGWYGAARDLGQ